jgi:death on curing protein
MIYLSFEQIIEIHDALIGKFGGLLGIRERGLWNLL